MFDSRQTQINETYLSTTDAAIQTSGELAKVLIEIGKIILEKLKESRKANKIAVEIGKDIYNLVPDESTPGAYKWEKVDLTNQGTKNNQETNIILMPDLSTEGKYTILTEPFSDYLAQAIAVKLVEDVPDLNNNYRQTSESTLKITAYLDSENSDKQIVLYEQNSEGKCTTNLVTETLTQEEIMDVASEPLVKLLPPSAEIIKNYEETKELLPDGEYGASHQFVDESENFIEPNNFGDDNQTGQVESLSAVADNILSELLSENHNKQAQPDVEALLINWSDEEEEASVSFLDDIDISNPPEVDSPPDDGEELNYRAYEGYSNESISVAPEETNEPTLNSDNQTVEPPLTNTGESIEVRERFDDYVANNVQAEETNTEDKEDENPERLQFFTQEPEELETSNRRRDAPEFTYQEVADSQGVEPVAQQWARQVEVPIYQIKNKQARQERYNGENKDIAETATAMLKKYGTLEQDGSRIYRSDAFVIRQQGITISIHRRNDELFGWENSLMEFKFNKQKELKITKKPTEMLAVERQEFLIVAEYKNDNGKLPDVNNADIRDVANSLGSLAPAGTIKTLEVFKQNEMLHSLNNLLIQANKEELAVGEFTIKRSRDPKNHRASLQLFKTTEEKGTQELVRFDLTKTEDGITKEVSKMNISDYDINKIQFIVRNAQKLNLEQVFGNEPPTTVPTSKEQPIQTAGDIPVKIHPYIAEEWANMVKHGGPNWGSAMNQGNEEILQRIKDNDGRLPIADQREMYFKILNYKTDEAEKKGDPVIDFAPLKNIMQDLHQWRGEAIKQQYTPTENIPYPQRQTVAAAYKTKSSGVEL
ncbi:MAG: hypothetical protein SAK29_11780 [Scytonema sp. PMC 1069.18]|nr:hypothetical protein [Scytonema sp. PMC 1069.18]MEC4880924.1 hypothetical protein [Scytonema sp. PMC 1070.18]